MKGDPRCRPGAGGPPARVDGQRGPLPQADLLAIYRRLIASVGSLEASERERRRRRTADEPERTAERVERCDRAVTAAPPDFAPAPTGRPPPRPPGERDLRLGPGPRHGSSGHPAHRGPRSRQRSRPEYEAALLDDLDRLGLGPDRPSTEALRAGPSEYRQSDTGPRYAVALARLLDAGACTPVTAPDRRSRPGGRPMGGRGAAPAARQVPGARLPPGSGLGMRVMLGDGEERWLDVLAAMQHGPVALDGDLLARDRLGTGPTGSAWSSTISSRASTWSSAARTCSDSTPAQIRLGRHLGRDAPPAFAHHPHPESRTARSSARPRTRRPSRTCSTPVDLPRSSSAWQPCSSG